MKNNCKECPWVVKSKHNDKWKSWISNLIKVGFRKDEKHNCHMVAPVWGNMTEKTMCKGPCSSDLSTSINELASEAKSFSENLTELRTVVDKWTKVLKDGNKKYKELENARLSTRNCSN